VTAKGGSLAFRSSASAAANRDKDSAVGDCTSFDFPVLLDGTSKHGNVTARLLLPKVGLDLRLQEPIIVQVPLLLSVVNTKINASADSTPFKVAVSLSRPAPAGGVAVQLQLGEPGAAKVRVCCIAAAAGCRQQATGHNAVFMSVTAWPLHWQQCAILLGDIHQLDLQPLASCMCPAPLHSCHALRCTGSLQSVLW
jgi:hypothetical protein